VSDGFPVTIENKLGRAEIPRRPERVVALGSTDADIAVALGVTPLGVPKYVYGDDRHVADADAAGGPRAGP
jgi:iron complex transport system substrate-binding protein